MGREVKRVPMDFECPIWKTWPELLCPHRVEDCVTCKGKGRTDAYQGVETLARLILLAGSDAVRRQPQPHPYFRSTPMDRVYPGIEEVTAGLAGRPASAPFGHDSSDAWRATDALIRAAGLDPDVWGLCPECEGSGEAPGQEETARLRDEWQMPDPPTGPGWQVWQTVSEGGPVSPVFATPEELARWLVAPGNDTSVTQGRTYDQWLAFITGPGWAPSFVATPETGLVTGVEYSARETK